MANGYTPSDDDLRRLSEHLCYEVEMTFHLADWLNEFAQPWSFPAHNAVLEAWTIHLRQLIDFFWPKGERRVVEGIPDAIAADFFEEGEWERLCPERPEVLSEAIRKKIGWGVVHLTYGRAWSKPEDKLWDFGRLLFQARERGRDTRRPACTSHGGTELACGRHESARRGEDAPRR